MPDQASKSLDVFLAGETVDLCIPTREFALSSAWYSWFNNPSLNQYLCQGAFPNTPEDQVKFWELEREKRLLLVLQSKTSAAKGVISLSSIDYRSKSAQIALVVDNQIDKRMSPWQSLESICLITQHGFEMVGLNRITAGQHVALAGWQQRMELAGYRIEGFHKSAFVKGNKIADAISIACNLDYFDRLVNMRHGRLWDSLSAMRERISKLPREAISKEIKEFYTRSVSQYYEEIMRL